MMNVWADWKWSIRATSYIVSRLTRHDTPRNGQILDPTTINYYHYHYLLQCTVKNAENNNNNNINHFKDPQYSWTYGDDVDLLSMNALFYLNK